MATDVQQLLLRIEASTELARREIAKLDSPLANMGANAEAGARQFSSAMQQVERSSARVQNATRNLGFQIGDFTTQVSTGTPIFQAFGQQAGQAAGALADFGGTVGKVGAFLSGPWGAILIAATTVLGTLALKHDEAEEKAAKQAAAENTLAGALNALDAATGAANVSQEENIRLKTEAAKEAINAAKKELEAAKASVKANELRALAGRGRTGNFGLDITDSGVINARANVARIEREILAAERRLEASAAIGQVRNGQTVFGVDRPRPGRVRAARAARTTAPAQLVGELIPGAGLSDDRRVAGLGFGFLEQQARAASIAVEKFGSDLEIARAVASDLSRLDIVKQEQIAAAENFANTLEQGLVNAAIAGRGFGAVLDGIARQIIASGLLNIISGGTIGTSFGTSLGGLGKLFGGFFANGGRPPVGRVSVVGERGPELFVPSVPGEIIPNYKLQGGAAATGGEQAVQVTVNPSPLFVTTVERATQAASGEAIRRQTRPRMPVSAGA